MKNVICLWLGLVLLAGVAPAATLYVAETGDDIHDGSAWALAKRSIQGALTPAVNGDTILVSNGTYTASVDPVVSVTKSVNIYGVNGPEVTMIDGENARRCVYVNATTAGDPVSMSGFTIRNGFAANGAGVYKGAYRDFYLSNCVVHANYATGSGGGIDKVSTLSQMTVNNCVISNNTAGAYGGGLQANSSRLFIYHSEIITNSAASGGGGIYGSSSAYTGVVFMAHACRIAFNRATNGSGGGINSSARADGSNLVSDCEIESNYASAGGGGVYLRSFPGPLFISNCVIRGNESAYISGYAGGGILIAGNGRMTGCLIAENRASMAGGYGGGVGINNGALNFTMENVTIVSNNAVSYGGGVAAPADVSASSIQNSILYGNISLTAIRSNVFLAAGSGLTFTNCCVAPLSYATDQPVTGASNLEADPLYASLAGGDYHLSRTSPCINAGANQHWMAGAADLDGRRRLDRWSGIVDMGCYEYTPNGTAFSLR